MSHISVWSKVKIKNLPALKKVCENQGFTLEEVKNGDSVRMYGSQTAKGIASIKLPDWEYPIVIDDKGNIQYDNFGSQASSMKTFGKLLQAYNREVIYNEIDFSKYSVEESLNDNGEIEMVLTEY